MPKNLMAKMRPIDNPYEIWVDGTGTWFWNVLKKWQVDDDKPYARWFCNVVTPIMPNGEMGDVYVSEIKQHAKKLETFPAYMHGFVVEETTDSNPIPGKLYPHIIVKRKR